MKYAMLLVFLFGSIYAAGQTKLEREYRIKPEAVPMAARAYTEALGFNRQVKWFVEESLDGKSVEAKTKRGKSRYSIEFDTSGRLQDIEVEIPWSEISAESRLAAMAQLDSMFSKKKIVKTQIQYTGSQEVLLALIRQGNSSGTYSVKYELVVKGTNHEGSRLYEFLFSDTGMMEKIARIILRSTDNLEY